MTEFVMTEFVLEENLFQGKTGVVGAEWEETC